MGGDSERSPFPAEYGSSDGILAESHPVGRTPFCLFFACSSSYWALVAFQRVEMCIPRIR